MGLFVLGLFLGMSHALEADHLLSISSMINLKMPVKKITFLGLFWGLGHTFTLLIITGLVVFFNLIINEQWGNVFEFSVGMVLVLLGLDVLIKMRKNRIHYHVHRHRDGVVHFHAHAHDPHSHPHSKSLKGGGPLHEHHHLTLGGRLKPFLVGLLHGGAGSLPLLTLALMVSEDTTTKFLYVMFFGLGSLLGMVAVTLTLSWPIKKLSRMTDKRFTQFYRFFNYGISFLTIALGVFIMVQVGIH